MALKCIFQYRNKSYTVSGGSALKRGLTYFLICFVQYAAPHPSARAERGHGASPEDTLAYGHRMACEEGLTFLNLVNLGRSGIFLEQEEDRLAC